MLLLLDVLVIFDTVLVTCRPWWERMGQVLGRLHFISENSCKEGEGSFASPSIKKIYCMRFAVQYISEDIWGGS